MSSALVIGGAGFIGSALCKRLLSDGYLVTSIDDYSSGLKINHLSSAEYIEGKSKDIDSLTNQSFDYVFHLGEYSRVEASFKNQNKVFNGNLASLYEVMKYCVAHKSKLIYSGSSSGFSDYAKENISPYTFIKKINVDIINQFAHWHDLKYAVCYFYNVYGPGEIGYGEYATVVEKFLQIKLGGGDYAPISAPGEQKRNFTYIDDIVNGLILVSAHGAGDGYGIGCDEYWSIKDLAKMIGLVPDMKPGMKGNRMSAPLATKKTKSLGWQWHISLPKYIENRLNAHLPEAQRVKTSA